MKKLLVLGVGNILMMDDGIGVHCIHDLLKEKWPAEVEFIDGGTFTQDIFYLFQEYEKILVLDVVMAGKKPGTMFLLKEKDLRENEEQTLSLHDIDLLDSLGMAELSGHKPDITVLGIQPEKLEWAMEMTDTIENAYPGFIEAARKQIHTLLQ